MEKLERNLKNTFQQIAERDQQLAERDQQLAERDQQLAERDQQLAERDQQLAERDQQLAERDQQLAERDQQLAERDQQLAERDQQVVVILDHQQQSNLQLNKKDTQIEEHCQHLDLLNSVLAAKEQQLQSIYNSLSWRLTNPIRKFINLLAAHSWGGPLATICSDNFAKLFSNSAKRRQSGVAVNVPNYGQQLSAVLAHIDYPNEDGTQLFYSFQLNGWAVHPSGIERIEVHCDETLLGLAQLEVPRIDVYEAHHLISKTRNPGFYYAVTGLTVGHHALELKFFPKYGEELSLQRTIEVMPFNQWLAKQRPSVSVQNWMVQISENFVSRPRIGVCLFVMEASPAKATKSIDALTAQTYKNWAGIIIGSDDAYSSLKQEPRLAYVSALEGFAHINSALAEIECDYLFFMRAGDILEPHAFYQMVMSINTDGTFDLCYPDEGCLAADGSLENLFFKPDWAPDTLLSYNYIGSCFWLDNIIFAATGGIQAEPNEGGLYDLLLRAMSFCRRIHHLPQILVQTEATFPQEKAAGEVALRRHLEREGYTGVVLCLPQPGFFRVCRELSGAPKITIIIPTLFKKKDLITTCLRSICLHSSYRNFELIIIDTSPGPIKDSEIRTIIGDTVEWRVIKWEQDFNWSAVNNLGAKHSHGEMLLFLNDDVEVLVPDWLEALLEHAQRPEVGVVGAKLLFPDGTVQHGGIVLVDHGGGGRHVFSKYPSTSEAYFNSLNIVRNCSAVTGACLMIRGQVFEELGGFDEELWLEGNDTDFCLRLWRADYRVVWTPFALLTHHELGTREQINVAENSAFLWERWGTLLRTGDPFYNQNLNVDSNDPSVTERPLRVEHFISTLPIADELSFVCKTPLESEKIKKILILKLDHIGDTILSLPAIQMLHERFPSARITMLIGSWSKSIIERLPFIEEILTFDFFQSRSEDGIRFISGQERDELQATLQERQFDMAIDFRRHPQTRCILKLSNAAYTIGYATGEDDSWMSLCLQVPSDIVDTARQETKPHATTQICQLVSCIPGTKAEGKQIPTFHLLPPKDEYINLRFPELFSGAPIIGIHPGVGSAIRQWPISYFAKLADMIVEETGAHIAIFGGPDEAALGEELKRAMKRPERADVFAGKTTFAEFMNLLTHCTLFIGNNSGPVHLAGALGTPTLVVFAGQVLPQEWQPPGDKTLVVRLKTACSPCYLALPEDCPYGLKCLLLLWPEKVMGAVRQMLALSGRKSEKTINTLPTAQANTHPALPGHVFT